MRFSPKLSLVVIFFFVLVIVSVFVGTDDVRHDTALASATISQELCGFAWGATIEGPPGTGTGWLSFNSDDCGDVRGANTIIDNPLCGVVGSSTPSYKVEIFGDPDSSGGSGSGLRGHAWSPNIGWVQFGNLPTGNFPEDSGTGPTQADGTFRGNTELVARSGTLGTGDEAPRTNLLSDFELRGWAQACVGSSDRECGSSIRTDGWAGFISLSNNLTNGFAKYHVGVSNGVFSGYSWDPFVSGWLNWGGNGGNVRFCGIQVYNFKIEQKSVLILNQPVPPNTDKSGSVQIVATLLSNDTPKIVNFTKQDPAVGAPGEGITSNFAQTSCTPSATAPKECEVTLNVNVPVSVPDGVYLIPVTGTSGGQDRTINVPVTVGSSVAGLDVDCSVVPQPAYYVNQPVRWKVDVSSLPGGQAPAPGFSYKAIFNGEAEANTRLSDVSSGNTFEVLKTYTTIGRKTFSVENLIDQTPSVASGCTPEAVITVTVNPDIIER